MVFLTCRGERQRERVQLAVDRVVIGRGEKTPEEAGSRVLAGFYISIKKGYKILKNFVRVLNKIYQEKI